MDRALLRLILPNLMLSLSADHVAAFTVWPHDAGDTTVTFCSTRMIARDDFDLGRGEFSGPGDR